MSHTDYQFSATVEERNAFEDAFGIRFRTPEQQKTVTVACMPAFVIGYRAAQGKAKQEAKPDVERAEASATLAEDLDYPGAWDTAAYPNLESAAIEAIHTANVAANSFAKELQGFRDASNGAYYTMDQMRDYAAGLFTTRAYVIVDALETKISEYQKAEQKLFAQGQAMGSGIYRAIVTELLMIAEIAKSLGKKPFQKRAAFWAKKCFGAFLATDARERNHRFAEEAIELVQACGMTKGEFLGAVDYVYGRPVGEKWQEVGGVYTTLALLCDAHFIDMVGAGERDLLEIDDEETTARIRAKRQKKPDFGSDCMICAKTER